MSRYDRFITDLKTFTTLPLRRRVALRMYLPYVYSGVELRQMSVLDVGGGTGLHSLFAASCGAREVVCLEPELEGSGGHEHDMLDLMVRKFPQVSVHKTSLQTFKTEDSHFDVIIMHNVINHLSEADCVNLLTSDAAKSAYRTIFARISRLSSSDATAVIADCDRANFFADHGMANPIAGSIEWMKHQSPTVWSSMLSDHGWIEVSTRWLTPFVALSADGPERFGHLLSYYLNSHYCLRMQKKWQHEEDDGV
jgi:SAM-dependent methyltransferase